MHTNGLQAATLFVFSLLIEHCSTYEDDDSVTSRSSENAKMWTSKLYRSRPNPESHRQRKEFVNVSFRLLVSNSPFITFIITLQAIDLQTQQFLPIFLDQEQLGQLSAAITETFGSNYAGVPLPFLNRRCNISL